MGPVQQARLVGEVFSRRLSCLWGRLWILTPAQLFRCSRRGAGSMGGEVSAGSWAYLPASVCYFPSLQETPQPRSAAL